LDFSVNEIMVLHGISSWSEFCFVFHGSTMIRGLPCPDLVLGSLVIHPSSKGGSRFGAIRRIFCHRERTEHEPPVAAWSLIHAYGWKLWQVQAVARRKHPLSPWEKRANATEGENRFVSETGAELIFRGSRVFFLVGIGVVDRRVFANILTGDHPGPLDDPGKRTILPTGLELDLIQHIHGKIEGLFAFVAGSHAYSSPQTDREGTRTVVDAAMANPRRSPFHPSSNGKFSQVKKE
jgi:hypothetical protein